MISIDWQHVRGIILDYGGTLDTAGRHWANVIWDAYAAEGVPVDRELFLEAYVHAERTLGRLPMIKPTDNFSDTLREKLCIEMSFIAGRKAGFEPSAWLNQVLSRLHSGAMEETSRSREVLERIAKHGPMVVVSNFYGNLRTVIDEMCLGGLFADVIESAVVGVRKPDPAIFTLGAKALGLQPGEVLVVGDSYSKDIAAGKAAGCQTAWFKGEGWGDDPEDTSAADYVISRLSDLDDGA